MMQKHSKFYVFRTIGVQSVYFACYLTMTMSSCLFISFNFSTISQKAICMSTEKHSITFRLCNFNAIKISIGCRCWFFVGCSTDCLQLPILGINMPCIGHEDSVSQSSVEQDEDDHKYTIC